MTREERRPVGELRLIWTLARRYPGYICAALIALMIGALATLSIPYGFKRALDQGFAQGGTLASIDAAFLDVLIIVVVLALATAGRMYFVSWLGERVVTDLRRDVQANLLRLAPRFFEANRPAEIASRLTSDTAVIEQVVSMTLATALGSTFTGIGGVVYLFVLAPKLAAVLLLGVPVIIAPILLIGKRVQSLTGEFQSRLADIGTIVIETLGALRVVQAYNQEPREVKRFQSVVEATFQAGRRRARAAANMSAVVTALLFGAMTGVLWMGAHDVAAGKLSGGAIAAFVFTGALVTNAFGQLSAVYSSLLRGAGAAARLSQLLTERPEIQAPAEPQAFPEPPAGHLSFEGVEFRYPTRPEIAALHDFSLTVAAGEMVAVVGPSGAGKSTLFQLAQRFCDPQAGAVRLDGVKLTEADPATVRRQFALVPQEAVIFAGSARDNLRYGRWEAHEDEIWAAAEAANAADFLKALPLGLDTFLGEGGVRLSGGQRQRIAIARAVLRDAPVLLLDEATSSLDAESERLVQEALERVMANRTTIVIAHRLATVRSADRIVVMDQGRIVEEGRHDELIAMGGLYARLARLQFEDHSMVPSG